MIDTEDKEVWTQRFKEAKQNGMFAGEFREKYGLRSYPNWAHVKDLVQNERLTLFPKKYSAEYLARRKQISAIAKVATKTKAAVISKNKPVFCVVVAFESKEAALSAMGKYL